VSDTFESIFLGIVGAIVSFLFKNISKQLQQSLAIDQLKLDYLSLRILLQI